jgi:phage N-6-adenine-methyltransferase
MRKMNTDVMFSSASDEWETPQDFFDKLNAEFRFTLDVCATAYNAKCKIYLDKSLDGLAQNWRADICWMNPPYGRGLIDWMRRAYVAASLGATVVCLVPSRTDTKWWHEYAAKGEIRLIRGRLRFGGAPNSAPFPSALVIFRPGGKPSVSHVER